MPVALERTPERALAGPDRDQAIRDFADHVSSGKVRLYQAFDLDFVPGRREGCYIWDMDGRTRLLDCRSSGGVFNLGHRPGVTIAALRAALDHLDCGDHLLLSAQRAALARRLADLLPGDLNYAVFGAGGGEAVDLAIKVARAYTGRPGVVSAVGGYHGHTGLALAAGDPKWHERFGPLAPGFRQVRFGDVKALEEALDDRTAAVLFETIPATGGINVPPDGFFPAVRRLCDERGALWIDDEVQTGLGRTGRLWAFEHYGVIPDMVVLGKGMTGGVYPLSATCLRQPLESVFHDDPFIHVSTCGGTDLGCVVTLAMLDEVSRPEYLAHVNDMAGLFAAGLERLGRLYPDLQKGVRQKGLMIGVVLADEGLGLALTVQMARNGVLALFAENDRRVLIVMPPLIISPGEVEFVLEALGRSYKALSGR